MGRVEHGFTPGHVDYFIEERLLKSYCSSMSFGFADFKRQLEKMFTVTYMARKDMTAKTKGPQMRVAVIKISRRIDDDEFTHQVPLVAA
jgi:fibronectin type 3 domain-containing protein